MSLIVWTNFNKSTSIFASINHLWVIFLLELSVDYPFSSKEKFSRSHGLPTSCQLRLWITHLLSVSYFMVFIMFKSMEEVHVVLRNIEHENQTLCEFVVHLQTNQALTLLGCILATQPQPKESQISLPNKFDGTRSTFRGFVNQVDLVIQLHLHR